jgi:hypothetical protein
MFKRFFNVVYDVCNVFDDFPCVGRCLTMLFDDVYHVLTMFYHF